MSPLRQAVAPTPNNTLDLNRHLVCGAGGSRAILGSAGAIMACNIAGITDWQTLGGISGGSIPTALLAGGLSAAEILKFAVEVDFSSLVSRHATPFHLVFAFLLKDRFEFTRPKKGVMSSDKLGQFIDDKIPTWPKNYWTMAVVGRTQIVFTADGVFQYLADGSCRQIADTPPSVGLAIRATCAVPGIIDAVPYKGRYLFDGALSWDGQCPVGVVTNHFKAKPTSVIGCDVGDESSSGWWHNFTRWFWSLACGSHCIGPASPKHHAASGVIMLEPQVTSVRSLQFVLTTDQKWEAVMSGFAEAVSKLAGNGLLTGSKLLECLTIVSDIELLKGLSAK